MRKVMFHAVDLAVKRDTGKRGGQFGFDGGALILVAQSIDDETWIGPLTDSVGKPPGEIRLGIAVQRDMVYCGKSGARGRQTIADGFRREAGPVLDAPKPLLLGRGNNLTIPHNAGCSVAVIGIKAQNNQDRTFTDSGRG